MLIAKTRSTNEVGRRFFAVMAGACIFAITTVARAEESPNDTQPYLLRWTRERGAETCIEASSLTHYLTQVSRRESAKSEENAIVLEGRIVRTEAPNQFQARVRVIDAHGELIGERVISTKNPRCSAINSSLLLVLAMMVNPNAAYEGIPAAVAEELRRENEKNEAAPKLEQTGELQSDVTIDARTQSKPAVVNGTVSIEKRTFTLSAPVNGHWKAMGVLTLATGVVPKPTLGLMLGVRQQFSSAFSMSLTVATWLPRSGSIVDGPWDRIGAIHIGATQLRTVLCRSLVQRSSVTLEACGGAHLGFRWFSAPALEKHYESTRLFYGPLLGLESSVVVSPSWRIRGGVNLSIQLPRDRFTYAIPTGQSQTLYRPTLFASDAFVGVEVVL